jgi:uncharacterized protein YpmS
VKGPSIQSILTTEFALLFLVCLTVTIIYSSVTPEKEKTKENNNVQNAETAIITNDSKLAPIATSYDEKDQKQS